MRQFHASKSVVAFLARPITPGNFGRKSYHLRRMCVGLFPYPPFFLPSPTETNVSSVHFNAAINIRRRFFCTLRVTDSVSLPHNYHRLSHIIIIAFRPVITYITQQYRCTSTLDTPCK